MDREEFTKSIVKLTLNSWDDGWLAAFKTLVEIADSHGAEIAIVIARGCLEK